MRLCITRADAAQARYLGSQDHGDTRGYYELAGAIVVVRGSDLHWLVGHVVDAAVGWDIAQPGFVVDEERIGTKRTKITIYRVLDVRRGRYPSLSQQIEKG